MFGERLLAFQFVNLVEEERIPMRPRNMKIAKLFLLVAFIPAVALADYEEDKKKYDECVAKVKRDYPLPPASINALKQLIASLCGPAPTPPRPVKK